MFRIILISLVWIGLMWSGVMVMGHNLHNLHIKQDGVKTTEPKFPHIWFGLFLLCLTSLLINYNVLK